MLDRRTFAAGALAAAATTSLHPASSRAAGGFQLFDATRFNGKPDDLDRCGLRPIRVVYVNDLWPGRDRDEPDLDFIAKKTVPMLAASRPDRLVLDIEHWEADGIDKLIAVVREVKRHMPGVRVGYYGLLPVRDYWSFQPGKEGRLIAYRQEAARWTALLPEVDDLYPTLYTNYRDPDGWQRMADAMLEAARGMGKPTYPFVWPQYHDTSKDIGLQPIEGDFWRHQLDTIKDAGCAGAVIWGTLAPGGRGPDGKVRRLDWDAQAPWWQATMAFAQANGLADGSCT